MLGDSRLFPWQLNEILRSHLNGRDYQVSQLSNGEVTLGVEEGGAELAAGSRALRDRLPVAPVEYAAPVCGEKRPRVRRMFDPQNERLVSI